MSTGREGGSERVTVCVPVGRERVTVGVPVGREGVIE